ncbi:hypothetical protein DL767_002586 [Monosporascus sp. MG133]|nr:hypothetical protein DL767_002586 [Monosporascus sp. MG133]
MNLTARIPTYQAIADQAESNGQWATSIGLIVLLTFAQQLGLLGQSNGQPFEIFAPDNRYSDCIQWIMETSPRQKPWSPQRIVHELMAIWFGSVHALSTTIVFAVHDLCLHPEYIAPLRIELERDYSQFERTAQGLNLLDSFIKESARLTPVEAMSTRRSALQPFEFSDGTKLNVGDWACTPVRSIMQSAKYYPDPLSFNGFRFADPSDVSQCLPKQAALPGLFQPKPSKLTDVDNIWHVWGTGRMACPGRYYASAVMKLILAQIIMNYDFELVQPNAPRWLSWRSTTLPRRATLVNFRARQRDTPISDNVSGLHLASESHTFFSL